ncbi:MAG: hypothetical protein HKL85_10460 [Acidimicrobiaceae bacterium]|nr:hypothetical protein [Acidimicrobiaceae bacterium]
MFSLVRGSRARGKAARVTKHVAVGGFSLFVLLGLMGFLAGPPSSAFAASLARTSGHDVVYGKVLNSQGKGDGGVRVVLYQEIRGKQKVDAIVRTNRLGQYRIPRQLQTGNYFIQFNNPAGTIHGTKEFHVTRGHDYRLTARLTVKSGFLFYLPIFSY